MRWYRLNMCIYINIYIKYIILYIIYYMDFQGNYMYRYNNVYIYIFIIMYCCIAIFTLRILINVSEQVKLRLRDPFKPRVNRRISQVTQLSSSFTRRCNNSCSRLSPAPSFKEWSPVEVFNSTVKGPAGWVVLCLQVLQGIYTPQTYWLVVSTHLKNISQNGNLPQIGVKVKIFETTT